MFNALYLWWFYAAGTRTSLAMRQAAKQRANVILNNAFATSPGCVRNQEVQQKALAASCRSKD